MPLILMPSPDSELCYIIHLEVVMADDSFCLEVFVLLHDFVLFDRGGGE